MMRALVIDDEVNGRELLTRMVDGYCPGFEVVGQAAEVQEGIALIREKGPDLVFLDVEMLGGTGFDILDAFPQPDFEFIFVTGYHAGEVRALQAAALEYLEKPVDLENLQTVLARIEQPGQQMETRMEVLAEQKPGEPPNYLVLPEEKGYRRIALDQVLYLAAEAGYVIFHFRDGTHCLATRPMAHFEDLLQPPDFYRIHKSYLVNCRAVVGFDPGRGGAVKLEGGVQLPIAVRRKSAFLKVLRS